MRLYAILALVALAGCATDVGDIRADLHQLALPDLQRAVEISRAAGDPEGLQCAQGLLAIVDKQQAALPEAVGVASEFARLRAMRLTLQNSQLLHQINLSCAAMFNEEVYTYGKLLGGLGLKAVAP